MSLRRNILMAVLLVGVGVPFSLNVFAGDKIEVFVSGQHYESLGAYKNKKAEQERAAEARSLHQQKDASAEKKTAKTDAVVDPAVFEYDPKVGKTWVINGQGKPELSQEPITQMKTIEINQPVPASDPQVLTDHNITKEEAPVKVVDDRVAGVSPSFTKLNEDFDKKRSDNVQVQKVRSSAEFEEALRRKIRSHQTPILLISDKKKVSVMELKEASGNTD